MFISIEPIAGCSGGTSGNRRAHDGAQAARDALDQARAFGQPHHAKPQRHHADQSERDGDGGFRAVESARRHLVEPIIPATDPDRQHDEREPDVIQHSGL
jgi:hypothetical protein